jgi:hypothetical protein
MPTSVSPPASPVIVTGLPRRVLGACAVERHEGVAGRQTDEGGRHFAAFKGFETELSETTDG